MLKIRDRAPLSGKKKKKRKEKNRPSRGLIPGPMASEALALYNEPRKHPLLIIQIYNI